MSFHKVKDHNTLLRDMRSKASINCDNSSLQKAKILRERQKEKENQINKLSERMDSFEQKLELLIDLLKNKS